MNGWLGHRQRDSSIPESHPSKFQSCSVLRNAVLIWSFCWSVCQWCTYLLINVCCTYLLMCLLFLLTYVPPVVLIYLYACCIYLLICLLYLFTYVPAVLIYLYVCCTYRIYLYARCIMCLFYLFTYVLVVLTIFTCMPVLIFLVWFLFCIKLRLLLVLCLNLNSTLEEENFYNIFLSKPLTEEVWRAVLLLVFFTVVVPTFIRHLMDLTSPAEVSKYFICKLNK